MWNEKLFRMEGKNCDANSKVSFDPNNFERGNVAFFQALTLLYCAYSTESSKRMEVSSFLDLKKNINER